MFGGLLAAAVLIFLSAWTIEFSWIRPSVEVPAEGAAGRTQWGGMIPELRNPPRIILDNDPYYWISYAREMAATGALRIRHTDLDNVPFGREVHWNSGFMGWLVLCGYVTSWVTGGNIHDAIATGALYANPALFLLLLLLAGWTILRRFGAGYAAGAVVLLAALPAVTWNFGYGRADHEGMHDAAAFCLLFGLLSAGVGWVRIRNLPDAASWARYWPSTLAARAGFIASAAGGGIALWVGATQQLFVFVAAGLALLGSIWLARPSDDGRSADGLKFEPKLLRLWGRVGCAVSLVLYAWEYFPDHLGMRLEVNHPLYALAWLGAAEVLFQFAVWRMTSRLPRGSRRFWLGLAVVAISLPAVALLFGPPEWHAWKNEFMRRQHNFINEFEPFSHSLQNQPLAALFSRFGLLPLAVPLAMALFFLRTLPRPGRALLLPGLFAAFITGGMMLVQVRWNGLFSISLVILTLAVSVTGWQLSGAWSRLPRRLLRLALPAIFLLPCLFAFATGYRDSLVRMRSGVMDPYLAWMIASRDVALNLKRIAARESVRVMSGPGQTPALHYFGGVHGTSALYWENIDGVRDAAAFFSDQGDARAREIARRRGITHVVIEQSPGMAEQSCAIYYGRSDPKEIEQSLAFRIANPLGVVPDWLEPVPYYGSPMAANFQMRIYRVRVEKL